MFWKNFEKSVEIKAQPLMSQRINEVVPEEIKRLIFNMLAYEHSERPTVDQILKRLSTIDKIDTVETVEKLGIIRMHIDSDFEKQILAR